MECPYCKKTMEDGFINSYKLIVWTHTPKVPHERWIKDEEGDLLISDETPTFKNSLAKQKAVLCRDCSIVIVLPDLKNAPLHAAAARKAAIQKAKNKFKSFFNA